MVKILPFVLFVLLSLTAIGQKAEYSLAVYSGESVFRGPGAQSLTTGVNPFGTISGNMFGGSADIKLVHQHRLFIGLQAGYEVLKSRINELEQIYVGPAVDIAYPQLPIGGYTTLTTHYININPYVGYRVHANKVAIDLATGVDIAYSLNSQQQGQTTAMYIGLTPGPNPYVFDNKISLPKTDTRLRFDVKAWYQHFGISAGYSYGISNYFRNGLNQSPYFPPAGPANADVVRLGLSYRLN